MNEPKDLLEDNYAIEHKKTVSFYVLICLYSLTLVIHFFYMYSFVALNSISEAVKNPVIQVLVPFTIILPIFTLFWYATQKTAGLILILFFCFLYLLLAIIATNKSNFSVASIFTLQKAIAPTGIVNSVIYGLIILLISRKSITQLFNLDRKYILTAIYCSIVILTISILVKAYWW